MVKSSSSSSSSQKKINKTNIKTVTKIRGGVGVTGKQAVNLVAVAGQIASNLTSTSAAVAQTQLQSGSAALGQISEDITGALTKLTGTQESQTELVKVAGIGFAALVAIIFFTRR